MTPFFHSLLHVALYALMALTVWETGRRWVRYRDRRRTDVIYEYLRVTSSRQPDERAREAAADLSRAVEQGLSPAGLAVLLFDRDDPGLLITRAATAASLMALRLRPGDGLLGRALSQTAPVTGPSINLEPELREPVSRLGRRTWAVPVATNGHSCGAVVVVPRHRSPFLHGELEFVRTLAGHAAASLDHAQHATIEHTSHPPAERISAHDGTAERTLGERLQQAQKMEAVGQLAGGVAHDFNNLLTAVLGHASMIESHPAYDRALNEHLSEIRRTAERGTALTRRLLAFSRHQAVEPRKVNLREVVTDLLPMLDRVLGDRVTLGCASDDTATWIVADPVQLEQVVLNLAINARDAMPAGGEVKVRTGTTTLGGPTQIGGAAIGPGAYVTLRVTDTGVGIDQETQVRMFEPFFTTKAAGYGTGLGLSTVHGIVRTLGGAIAVESARGRGASFEILIPAVPAPDVATPRPGPSGLVEARPDTILVVDDDLSVRRLVASWLKAFGYQVVAAPDLLSAVAMVEEHPLVSLVVTDVTMPGGSGPALVAALRQKAPNVRALYVSGYTQTTLTIEGHLPPDTDFLSKPFTREMLVERVRRILAAKTAAAT